VVSTPPKWTAFAVAAPGIAPLVAAELDALGIAHEAPTADGVAFGADWRTLATANLWLRTATRVLVRVASFRATDFRTLEREGRRIDWGAFVAEGQPVALRVTCRKSRLYHSDAVAQRVHDAIAHVLGARVPLAGAPGDDDEGEGGDDAALAADVQPFVVRVAHDVVTISVDASGIPLHKRGWRTALARAPMRETLAAACLLGAGWESDAPVPFVDPLCGSGTLAIEAALSALGRAPGRWRRFAWERWRDAPAALLSRTIRESGANGRTTLDVPIVARDRDPGAVRMTRENAERAGVDGLLTIEQGELRDFVPPAPSGLWVSNAPWGVRVASTVTLDGLFRTIGAQATGAFRDWRVAILLADATHLRALDVEVTPILRTRAGGIQILLAGLEPGG
jgi:putative N6-adenine-specific DNA methylase